MAIKSAASTEPNWGMVAGTLIVCAIGGFFFARRQRQLTEPLLMNIHAQTEPEHSAPWESVSPRWGPDPAAAIANDADLTELIVLIMGEGLWIHDHITETKLSADNRAKLIEFMLSQLPEEN